MVELLLAFIRSTREGDWKLHCACLRDLLPWMFAYDRVNYSRYMTIYWSEMTKLHDTHPSAHQQLLEGEFAVQRCRGKAFAQVGVDHCIEQTLNFDSRMKLVGITLKPGAHHRWLLTAHERSAVARACRKLAGLDTTSPEFHKESGKAACDRSEKGVQSILSMLQSCQDPFAGSDSLCNFVTGLVASEEVENDCLQAKNKGESALKDFMTNRLDGDEPAKSFFDTLPKISLKTFSSLLKQSSVTVDNAKVVLKADRSLFARMVVVAQTRLLNMPEVLCYELGPLPWSLATGDGSLTKTAKSKLLNLLEDGIEPAEDIPPNAAIMIDAMAVLQAAW